ELDKHKQDLTESLEAQSADNARRDAEIFKESLAKAMEGVAESEDKQKNAIEEINTMRDFMKQEVAKIKVAFSDITQEVRIPYIFPQHPPSLSTLTLGVGICFDRPLWPQPAGVI
ncbi:hypothetical protein CYMTET_31007, partial [Cymbomonas tetramitiformis]